MTEPTLSQVHADMIERFEHDKRLRAVEQDVAALRLLPAEVQRMEGRLVEAIKANAPKSPWPAVSALAGVLGIVLVVAAAIYGR